MKPMQAMIWKEIRQNLPWTGFLFVASAGAFAYAVKHAPAGYIYSDEPVLGQAFCLVSRLGFLGLEGVLGLLGTVFDSRPDAWAFLVHRPEPRTTIFWSKLLAAWIAYLLVAGLPLGGAIIWVMQTERLGRPFYWEMGLVHISDLFAGAAAVPLGMIVGLRPARWYAGRGIPLLAMFLGIGLAELTREFWHCVPLLTFWGSGRRLGGPGRLCRRRFGKPGKRPGRRSTGNRDVCRIAFDLDVFHGDAGVQAREAFDQAFDDRLQRWQGHRR